MRSSGCHAKLTQACDRCRLDCLQQRSQHGLTVSERVNRQVRQSGAAPAACAPYCCIQTENFVFARLPAQAKGCWLKATCSGPDSTLTLLSSSMFLLKLMAARALMLASSVGFLRVDGRACIRTVPSSKGDPQRPCQMFDRLSRWTRKASPLMAATGAAAFAYHHMCAAGSR